MNMFSGFDVRGRFGETMTVEYAWNIGKALADWLPEDGSVIVAVGEQAKPELVHAVVEGLRLQGRAVVDAGVGNRADLVAIAGDTKVAGGVIVGHDQLQELETIELYQESMAPVTAETGLQDIATLVEAGNFVPAAVKGELTAVA